MTETEAIAKLRDLLEGTIDHFDLDDAMDMLYEIKYILKSIDQESKTDVPKMNVGKWIPVSEDLPKEGEDVLVWYEYFRYGNYNRMWQTYGIGWQYDGHFNVDNGGTKQRVIAWCPLPKGYKESEG